jgi:hypothetical protein
VAEAARLAQAGGDAARFRLGVDALLAGFAALLSAD